MTMNKEIDSLFDDTASAVVTVTPPGSHREIHLRYPSFDEWHALARAHWALEGQAPDSELIAKTIAVCAANADGTPLGESRIRAAVLKANPVRVMWLYKKCWSTVLKSDEETIAELEKN